MLVSGQVYYLTRKRYSELFFFSKGKRNYRFFFQFLAFLCLHVLVLIGCSLIVVLNTPIHTPPAIASISLLVLIGVLLFPIGGLFIFHMILVSKGRTTNEHVTGKYRGMSFFSRGFAQNFMYLCCGSLSPQYKPVVLKKNKKPKQSSEKTDQVDKYGQEGDANNLLNRKSSIDTISEKKKLADIEQASLASNRTNRGSLNSDSINDVDEDDPRCFNASFRNEADQDLFDTVLKNNLNRKSLISLSDTSSISSAQLNKSRSARRLEEMQKLKQAITDSPALAASRLASNVASINANSTIKAQYYYPAQFKS